MSMQPGSGGKPHPQPQQPSPQQPYPQQPPQVFPEYAPQQPHPEQHQPEQHYGFQEGDSGRSGLLVGLVLGGVFLLIVVLGGGIAVGVYFYAAEDDKEETRDDDDISSSGTAQKTNAGSSQSAFKIPQPPVPKTAQDSGPPKSVAEAVEHIKGRAVSSKKNATCEWLATQPVDAGQQSTVARALEELLGSPLTPKAATKALAVWGDETSVDLVHTALKGRRADVKSALKLFARFPNQSVAETTASYLGDSANEYEAFKTLQAIGKPAAPYIIEHLGSSKGLADQYARQLVETWGVEVDDAVIDRYLVGLRSDNPVAAAQALANLPLKADRQNEVARALDAVVRVKSTGGKLEALRALEVWGDKDSIPSVIEYFTTAGLGRGKPAIAALVKFDDERATEALVSKLGDFFVGKEVRAALIEMGPSCEAALVACFNDINKDRRNGAREIVEMLDTDEKTITERCIADLRAPEDAKRVLATEWLATAEVDEMRRDEVSQFAVTMVESNPALASRVLSRWGTTEHSSTMLHLLKNRDQKVWEPSLRALIELGLHVELAPELNRMMGDFWFQAKTPQVLLAIGPAAEDVLIELLKKSENEKVLTKTCTLLVTIGSQKSAPDLKKLNDKAKRFKRRELELQSQNALRAIESRPVKDGG